MRMMMIDSFFMSDPLFRCGKHSRGVLFLPRELVSVPGLGLQHAPGGCGPRAPPPPQAPLQPSAGDHGQRPVHPLDVALDHVAHLLVLLVGIHSSLGPTAPASKSSSGTAPPGRSRHVTMSLNILSFPEYSLLPTSSKNSPALKGHPHHS